MQEGPPDGRIASDAARPAPDHSLALSLFLPGHGPVNELLLARHGETEWSASGRHTSRTDLPLTGNGRQLAGRLAPRLADRRFALVLTSPLRRAVETCELAGLGAEAQVRDELREWDYGDYEGITTAEIQRRRPGWSLWRDGCPNGEVAAEVGSAGRPRDRRGPRGSRRLDRLRSRPHAARPGRPLARAGARERRPVRARHGHAEHAGLRARHRRDLELERAPRASRIVHASTISRPCASTRSLAAGSPCSRSSSSRRGRRRASRRCSRPSRP